MPLGLPSQVHDSLIERFVESFDDETCPSCSWETEIEREDLQRAFNAGRLLAMEQAEGAVFKAMAGATLYCLYWRCPECETYFTTEEEANYGAMT